MMQGFLAGLIRVISGANARWMGSLPEAKQCIYFANHTSHLDAVVLWASLPADLRARTRPVAAKDYWDKTRLRRYLASKIFRAVLIDRTKVTAQNNPIEFMLEAMGETHSLILFPEGTRGVGDEISAFKSGLHHLARAKPEAAFVPVFIENLNRVLPKGEILPVPLLSSITFGPALPKVESETKAAFLERARLAVAELRPHT